MFVGVRRIIFLLFPFLISVSTSQHRFLENGNPLARGSDSGLFPDTPTRVKIDLSGQWEYTTEEGGAGVVRVPSSYDFVGKVTFERSFAVDSLALDRYDFSLVMLGVNYSCEISINGDYITNHVGGYTSFSQPIQRRTLQEGNENRIRVVVSNELDPRRTIPLRSQVWGWRNYGGIIRDVYILGVPKLSVRDVVHSQTFNDPLTAATVSVTASIQGEYVAPEAEPGKKAPSLAIYVEAYEKVLGLPVARSSMQAVAPREKEWNDVQLTVQIAGPKLWSPETPELYVLKTFLVEVSGKDMVVLDEFDQNIGLHAVEIRKGRIIHNGRPVTLQGVIWEEEHPTYGNALPYEEMERDIVLIKTLGANAIRFSGRPPHPYMLNLCDRYGLFALEEMPLRNLPAPVLADETYLELAMAMTKEMIARDRHHASLLAWGLGDQLDPVAPSAGRFVGALRKVARAMDNRLLFIGERQARSDSVLRMVDIVALNIAGGDAKAFRRTLDAWKGEAGSAMLMAGRFGTEVQPGNRNGYSDPHSAEAQARFYLQRLDALRDAGIAGGFIWSFNDWKGDRPSLVVTSGDPWVYTMGLVSAQRERRLAYDAVRSVYRGEKFASLPAGNYSSGAPIVYVLAGLVVLISLAYLYNGSRRFRDSLLRSTFNAYNFFADVRDQRVVSLVHSVLLGIIVSVALAIVTSSILYHFRGSWVVDTLLSTVTLYDNIKESAVRLIWDPVRSILYFSLLYLLALLVLWVILMIISPMFRLRMYPYHAFAITMWSTPPLLVLVPVGMIVYRIMESRMYVLPSIVLPALLLAWVFLRVLKGIAIMVEVARPKMYILGVLVLAAVTGAAYVYLDATQAVSVQYAYLYHVLTGAR